MIEPGFRTFTQTRALGPLRKQSCLPPDHVDGRAEVIHRMVARGVTVLVANPYADVMMLRENVVTASMLDAMIVGMLSTASARR